MRAARVVVILILAAWASSCAPSLQRIGREQGCEAAEENIQVYIVRQIKRERFEKNLPYRAALMPVSLTIGFLLNYVGQLTMVLPVLAPAGLNLSGGEFKALYLQEAITYSPLKGSKLDHIDDAVIANANFDVGYCYYHEDNWAQASTFFEGLLDSRYSRYIGEENLYFLLGDCYYMLSLYDRAVENYREFLNYCRPHDDRIGLVEQRIQTIEAMHKKGLWGIENEENEENEEYVE